jgi:hypothetical protein
MYAFARDRQNLPVLVIHHADALTRAAMLQQNNLCITVTESQLQ